MAPIGRPDGSVAVNVESLVDLGNFRLAMPPSYCIFKTPSILFRHRKNAFLPNCFSIGPMHHGKENLIVTEKIKMKYLKGLLLRMAASEPGTGLSEEAKQQKILIEWINAVNLIEKEASNCYAGHDYAAEFQADEFVRMLVLDACFIIELFRKDAGVVTKDEDDPIFSMSCMLQFLHHDLILLENQIPWFVLQTLFNKTNLRVPSETQIDMSQTLINKTKLRVLTETESNMSLIDLALHFFATMFSSIPPPKADLFVGENIWHILDLLRLSLVLPSKEIKNPYRSLWQPIRSLSKLKDAGVKFVKVSPESILDIKFNSKKGVLEIPSLLIQETTETILRNLIAYEQCLPNCKPIFISYAKVLDNLIDTPSDLDVLCKSEIWDNWLSPEDATEFFNKLYNDTYVKEFYYSKLCDDLNSYCKWWWPTWRAFYVHNYFSRPWAIAAQIYAVIILGLTVWQCLKKG